ncbi:MAG: hypothetical protein ACMXYC_01535 [Candidatus Woesearchaeota archaeon]
MVHKQLLAFLKPFVGDMAGLLVAHQMQVLHIQRPLDKVSEQQRKVLADRLCDEIFVHQSFERSRVLRSSLYDVLEVQSAMHPDDHVWKG